mmetsp:Transcript_2592/g.8150  ORF Transcript_2592/g.8150 Transcript_2592/m.8150 type:complete len:87 (+) Transcript_2592:1714-1974(+)
MQVCVCFRAKRNPSSNFMRNHRLMATIQTVAAGAFHHFVPLLLRVLLRVRLRERLELGAWDTLTVIVLSEEKSELDSRARLRLLCT